MEGMWRAIALGIPKFDMRLVGGQAYGVAAVSLSMSGVLPNWTVRKPFIKSSKCEGPERELRQETRVIRLVLRGCLLRSTCVVYQTVVRKTRFRHFVEGNTYLYLVRPPFNKLITLLTHQMIN